VHVGLCAEEPPRGSEGLDDVRVGLLDGAPGEVGHPLVEASLGRDRVLERDPVLLAEPEVVLAESDRGVDEAGALLGGHEVGLEDGVAERAVVGDVGEGRLVGGAGKC
jgi:hypothetical protein